MALITRARGSVHSEGYLATARRGWSHLTRKQRGTVRRQAAMAPYLRAGYSRTVAYQLAYTAAVLDLVEGSR